MINCYFYSLGCSLLTRSLTHALACSLTHSLAHSLTHSLTCLLAHSPKHIIIYSFISSYILQRRNLGNIRLLKNGVSWERRYSTFMRNQPARNRLNAFLLMVNNIQDIHTHTHTPIHTHADKHTQKYTHIYAHAHSYSQTKTHTHTHTHTHIPFLSACLSNHARILCIYILNLIDSSMFPPNIVLYNNDLISRIPSNTNGQRSDEERGIISFWNDPKRQEDVRGRSDIQTISCRCLLSLWFNYVTMTPTLMEPGYTRHSSLIPCIYIEISP